MYQILYISDCLISEEALETEIRKIRTAASVNNKRDEITGLFLLVENRFLQLMEGEEANVRSCFGRIKNDPRHKDLRMLVQRSVEKRLFPKWSMHFYRLSGQEALEKMGVNRLENLDISNWKEGFEDDLAILLLESFARLGTKIS